MSTTSTTSGGFGYVATRTPVAGRWQWVGTANGCEARHLTDDPDLYLTAEALSSPRLRGVALIDEVGRVYATRFELTHFAPLVAERRAARTGTRELAQRVLGLAHHEATYPRAVVSPPTAGLRRALAAACREIAEAASGPDYVIPADDLVRLAAEFERGGSA